MIPQPRARRRHEKILDAALRVFAKKGYRDAAVEDIASESRTSKGGVYFHFPGKQAIFQELLNRSAARLRGKIEEAIEAESDPIARADAALLVVLRTFASHRALARLFMIEALGAGKEFHQRLSEIHAEFATIIKEQLDEAVKRGVIRPLDTQVAATAWFGALNEVVTRWLLTGKPGRLQDAYDALRPLLIRSVGVADSSPGETFEETLRRRLTATFTRAKEASRDRNQPVLASISLECPALDPLAAFAATPATDAALWLQPSVSFAAVAVGAAAKRYFEGPARFDAARHERQKLLDGAVVDAGTAPLEAPVAFAAFSFAEKTPASAQTVSDGMLIVPELLWTNHGTDAWLTISIEVDSSSNIERLVTGVEARVASAGSASPVEMPENEAPCIAAANDRRTWESAVARAVEKLKRGDLEKVVLARKVTVGTKNGFGSVTAALERLRQRYQSCTVFAFKDDDSCFFGATPERLFRVQDGVVSVDCLAGSIARGADEGSDRRQASQLLHDPKELHEHQVVASAIEEALQPLCADIAVAAAPCIASFPNVHHLYTPITGMAMPGHDVLDFVEKLHPTPATGGQPRGDAISLIRELETFDRGWYAGPVGWLDAAGNGDFAVGIRSGLASGDEVTLYAGSGIVAESEPSREYDETNVKLKAMLWALGQQE